MSHLHKRLLQVKTFATQQIQFELNGFLTKWKKNLKGGKTGIEILKPADKVASPFIGMPVGVKTRNPQSTHTTTNILKTESGGKKPGLTDERLMVSVKSLYSFDSKKYEIK